MERSGAIGMNDDTLEHWRRLDAVTSAVMRHVWKRQCELRAERKALGGVEPPSAGHRVCCAGEAKASERKP
jgi:hypothetical protein